MVIVKYPGEFDGYYFEQMEEFDNPESAMRRIQETANRISFDNEKESVLEFMNAVRVYKVAEECKVKFSVSVLGIN